MFRELERFSEAHVNAKKPRSEKIVSLAGFAGIRIPESTVCVQTLLKYVWFAVRVGVGSRVDVSNQKCLAVLFVVGRERICRNAEGESSRPSTQTRQTPPSEKGIHKAARIATPFTASPIGEIVEPVKMI